VGGGAGPTVFISHSTAHDDDDGTALLARVRALLEESGAAAWLDGEDLVAGPDWNDRLHAAIGGCDAAVLLVSERYLRHETTYARDEALILTHRARNTGLPVLVVRFPTVDAAAIAENTWFTNIELDRHQSVGLPGLDMASLRGALATPVRDLLAPFCSARAPVAIREYYVRSLERSNSLATAAQAIGLGPGGLAPTPRALVDRLLSGATPRDQPVALAALEALVPPGTRALRTDVDRAVVDELARDSIAFGWLADDVAEQVERVMTPPVPPRPLFVIDCESERTVDLHLRRVRQQPAALELRSVGVGNTRDGVVRAVCKAVEARLPPSRELGRGAAVSADTVPNEELEDYARRLDRRIYPAQPHLILLDPDVCEAELVGDLPRLFANVVFIAVTGEADDLVGAAVVRTPPIGDEEFDLMRVLDYAEV
jgi:hypothetical protein